MKRTAVPRRWSLTLVLLVGSAVLHGQPTAPASTAARIDDEAAAVLTAAARFSESPDVREHAVRTLGEMGDATTLPDIQQALFDPDRRVRRAAIEALADVRGDAALWTLAPAMHDSDRGIREDAVYAAGRIGGAAAKALVQMALADLEDSVREAATQVLEELSDGALEPETDAK